MKAIVMMITFFTSGVFFSNDKLTGKWESKPSEKGNITSIVFKADNSFEGYVNKKPFVSGNYTLTDSIFSFVDNGCGGARGTYRIILFSNSDSLRFEPIEDECLERKQGMSRLIIGRKKL